MKLVSVVLALITLVTLPAHADAIDDQLIAMAKEQNTHAGEMASPVERFDGVTYANRTLTFKFTVLSIKAPASKGVRQSVIDDVAGGVCSVDEAKAAVDAGVKIKYIYKDVDGKLLVQVDVDKKICEKYQKVTQEPQPVVPN